jgi:hypothetical protein
MFCYVIPPLEPRTQDTFWYLLSVEWCCVVVVLQLAFQSSSKEGARVVVVGGQQVKITKKSISLEKKKTCTFGPNDVPSIVFTTTALRFLSRRVYVY